MSEIPTDAPVCWERDTGTFRDAVGILADEERDHRTPHVHLGPVLLILRGLLDGPTPMVGGGPTE